MTEHDEARPSATVVLVRAASGAPEIFMVRRHQSTAFGSAYAFPGGTVDADDAQVSKYCGGLAAQDANHRLGLSADGLSYYSAAIRELFEESGVLLGDLAALDEPLQSVRDALNDRTQRWADIVQKHQLTLHCDALSYVSHWITPPSRPHRYSTRFFVALMPDGQQAVHCGGELTDSQWVTAADMLRANRKREVELHFPTIKTLESVARHASLDALLEWAHSSVDWGVTTMLPMIITRNGREVVALPGEMDYPGAKA